MQCCDFATQFWVFSFGLKEKKLLKFFILSVNGLSHPILFHDAACFILLAHMLWPTTLFLSSALHAVRSNCVNTAVHTHLACLLVYENRRRRPLRVRSSTLPMCGGGGGE